MATLGLLLADAPTGARTDSEREIDVAVERLLSNSTLPRDESEALLTAVMLHMRDLGHGAERAHRLADRLRLEKDVLSSVQDVLSVAQALPRGRRERSRKTRVSRSMMSGALRAVNLMAITDIETDVEAPVRAAFLLGCAYVAIVNAGAHSKNSRQRSAKTAARAAEVTEKIRRALSDPKLAKLSATRLAIRLQAELHKSATTLERMIRLQRRKSAAGP